MPPVGPQQFLDVIVWSDGNGPGGPELVLADEEHRVPKGQGRGERFRREFELHERIPVRGRQQRGIRVEGGERPHVPSLPEVSPPGTRGSTSVCSCATFRAMSHAPPFGASYMRHDLAHVTCPRGWRNCRRSAGVGQVRVSKPGTRSGIDPTPVRPMVRSSSAMTFSTTDATPSAPSSARP